MSPDALVVDLPGETRATPQRQPATQVHPRVSGVVFAYSVASFGSPGKAIKAATRAIEEFGEALDRLADS